MTSHEQHEQHELPGLDDRLHELAERAPAPSTAVGDDLQRGRRRLRRQRLTVGGAALATVLVVGAGAAVGPGMVDRAQSPDVAGGTDGPNPTPSETPRAQKMMQIEVGDPRPVPWGTPLDRNPIGTGPDHDATLVAWQEVLAEHVDPQWEHLVRRDGSNANQQSTAGSGQVLALGSRYGWQNPGQDGLGMLQIAVNRGWREAMHPCHDSGPDEGWQCEAAEAPEATEAWVAERDGQLSVAVEQADDGEVVVLTADPLFGNNSRIPVDELGLSAEALLQAAADPRLSLPADYESAPLLDAAEFEQAGRDLLGPAGADLRVRDASLPQSLHFSGAWRDGRRVLGELSWEAVATYGVTGELVCQREIYVRCEARTVDGVDVLVGEVQQQWGGGWEVTYAGPVYEVQVAFEPKDGQLPIERGYAFVVDPRWQPEG
ncbi:hypothetical protein [Nocardioides ferulae]|uniref:hypothetical protein n=1 Tax=Nocardioides ferulae TaxID=2340821 RepID=UPI000EAD3B57|nr:hypothetical protein [Nocardioides ferulae]